MKRFILVVMIVFMIPFLAGAQEVQELSLRKAIEYAVEHNKQLQVSRKDIDLYRQKVRESVSQGLPQVMVVWITVRISGIK